MPSVQASPSASLLLRPADIRAALAELVHEDSQMFVRDPDDHEVEGVIVGVDRSSGAFFWRPRMTTAVRGEHAWLAPLTGGALHFSATSHTGARLHFRVPPAQLVRFADGSAVWFSPQPERLSRLQQRKTRRTVLPGVSAGCTAAWLPPAATHAIHFVIHDLSIEGIGLRCEHPVTALPARGEIMRDVRLQLGQNIVFIVDLDVRNVASRTTLPSGTPFTQLGALFVGLNIREQVRLQQRLRYLEKHSPPAR